MPDTLPADLSKVDPADAWKLWRPTAGAWDRRWAAHLYRRAGFGATPAEAEKALAQGLEKTLDQFMTGEADQADRLDLLTEGGQFYTEPVNLRVWWLYAMTEGGHPLREKLALFWHNHFATSYAKVRSTQLMYRQNVTIRQHALGTFRPLLLDMSRDTAMLVWLDSNRNVKGAPNENFAREVMELFALGVGGNYTEKDIQEAARALTGWHHDAEVKQFEFRRDLHDDGTKTIFGKTGKWTGEDVIRLCCDHAACARFLVAKLYAFLVSETPPPKALLEPLADRFRKSDYDVADLVRAVLGSRLFFSAHAYRKRVKWPVECALGAVRSAVAARVPLAEVVDPLAKMGQALFAPPNVKRWRTGTDWLNSATLLARNNFAEKVAVGGWNKSGRSANGGNALVDEPVEPKAEGEPKPKAPAVAPTPDAKFDVCAAIYATAPKDVGEVVARMGELLYGEAVLPAQAQQIALFLRTPGPAAPPQSEKKAAPSPKGKGVTKSATVDAPAKDAPPADRVEQPSIFGPGRRKVPPLDSPEFKARVREAYHAMMCLPEYQLS